jgi:diguanylate cyclase (GGDEF)-like protein
MQAATGGAVQHLAWAADPIVVLVSFVATVVTSFLALELAGRTLRAGGASRPRWLLAAGATMGGGLWAMHFLGVIGMPSAMELRYRLDLVAASLVVAVAGATLALGVVARRGGAPRYLLLAASSMAAAITGLHYVAMAAAEVDGRIAWDASTVVLSVGVAVGGSLVSLAPVALGGDGRPSWRIGRRLATAVGIGLTGEAVHHTGMAAATVVATPGLDHPGPGVGTSAIAALLGLAASVVVLLVTIDAGRQKRRAEAAADLALVTRVSREFGRRGDARSTVCETARDLLHCDVVVLFEPGADGTLAVRGSAGQDPDSRIELASRDSVAGGVLRASAPRFVPDMRRVAGADPVKVERTGMIAALFEPVVLDGHAVGVLMAAWRTPAGPPTDRVRAVAALLAAESAVAVERSDVVARLTRLALVDGLTGLPNRRAIDDALDATLARAVRTGQQVTVAMVDVDHFKDFNDVHGHPAGDRLLATLASGWLAELRGHDVVGRYGGEEFLLLLPGVGPQAARSVVERLRDGTPEGVTCSFGLATWDGTEAPAALLDRADGALYAAKRAGRDRVVTA